MSDFIFFSLAKISTSTILNPFFITGFINRDGSFFIIIKKNKITHF